MTVHLPEQKSLNPQPPKKNSEELKAFISKLSCFQPKNRKSNRSGPSGNNQDLDNCRF